jgi:chitosanase
MITKEDVLNEVVSVNENSAITPQYDYVEALGDGRGFTCGIIGFTTSDGDCQSLFERYRELVPLNILEKYIPILQMLQDSNEKKAGSTKELTQLGFEADFKKACADPLFRQAQRDMRKKTYYDPACKIAINMMPAPSWILLLYLYDACIQHGETGPDSMTEMAYNASMYSIKNGIGFLEAFAKVRTKVLLNPQDSSTQEEWSQSVGRVEALERIRITQNFDLNTPFEYNPFGTEFTIGA